MNKTIQIQKSDLLVYQIIKQVEGDKVKIKLIRINSKNPMATEGKTLARYLIDEYPEIKINDLDIVDNNFIVEGELRNE